MNIHEGRAMEASERQQQVTNQTTWVANCNESVKPYIDEQQVLALRL